ncbi:hypothetical protein PMAC_003177 [Pneumocystis sp. 'macacae']|nr:hypothetical protein PMAC_003177 [Pneumocystis sp. 'macacae']
MTMKNEGWNSFLFAANQNVFPPGTDENVILKKFCSEIIEVLYSQLEQKARTLAKKTNLLPIFLLNNLTYIEKNIKNTALSSVITSDVTDKFVKVRKKIINEFLDSWKGCAEQLLDVTYVKGGITSSTKLSLAPKERDIIKEKFKFDELLNLCKTFVIYDSELKYSLVGEVKRIIVPLYTRFYNKPMVNLKNNDLCKDRRDIETGSFMTSTERNHTSMESSDIINIHVCTQSLTSLSMDIQKILHYLLPLPSMLRKFYSCKFFKLADSTLIPVSYIRERISQFAPEHWLNTRTCTHYLSISPYSRRFYPIHDIVFSSQCVFMPQKTFLRSSAHSIYFIIKYLPHPPSFSVILHWLYTNNTRKLYRNILRAIKRHKTLEWIKGFSLNIRSLGLINQKLVGVLTKILQKLLSSTCSIVSSLFCSRGFSSTAYNAIKVSILGAGGGIGQPLSLLLKMNSRISELALYDIRGAPGVAADCSHINTPCKVSGYGPEENGLFKALKDADIVLVPAGVPRKPGMTRDDLFVTNASIVRDLAKFTADVAPTAHLLIISNPVNSTVPICAEVYKRKGVYNPKRLFGITTLDAVRASWFVSEMKNTDPRDENVDIVGGHSGVTIVPLLSKISHNFTDEEIKILTTRIQFAGDEVVKAKSGTGSATLSMAYAAARFTNSLLRGIQGERDVIESAFIETTLYLNKGCRFFSVSTELGLEGVEKVYPFEDVSTYEKELLEVCYVELQKNIEKGIKFVQETY